MYVGDIEGGLIRPAEIVNDGAADSAADVVTITASSTPIAADTLILNIDGGGDTLYTETYVTLSNSSSGFDPTIRGYYSTSTGMTAINLYSGYIGGINWDERLDIVFTGSGTGTYADINSNVSVTYYTGAGLFYLNDGTYSSASITVTQYDAVGGRIKGTFNAAICDLPTIIVDACELNLTTFVGSFDVTRDADL